MTYKYNPPTGNVTTTRSDIKTEFDRWNAQAGEIVISDYDLPLANRGQIEASVVFLLRGARINVRIDAWDSFQTNLRCCYLNIRDMRLAEARGSLASLRESLLGLPAPVRERDPFEVLQLRPGASAEMIEAAYRTLAKQAHPDTGGNEAAFKELQAAYEKAKQT